MYKFGCFWVIDIAKKYYFLHFLEKLNFTKNVRVGDIGDRFFQFWSILVKNNQNSGHVQGTVGARKPIQTFQKHINWAKTIRRTRITPFWSDQKDIKIKFFDLFGIFGRP